MDRGNPDTPLDRRVIEKRAADFAAHVPVPVPWNLDEYARLLTAEFGKPVRFRPLSEEVAPQDLSETDFSGALIESEHSITIYFDDSGGLSHQQDVILHEVGHRVLGHVTQDDVLCRSTFASPRESEAEQFARALLYRFRGGDTLQLAPHVDDPHGVRSLGGALADIE
ncbi:ImmA/IrrE family metallo-endopeptidase [Lentzea jiangxiensis]|uniref:ImmA/IrrE family metallo-endopeptidase n=1 Tax=Lentzea jiangxiensis TaxID=641025 RepID=UPI00115FB27C|nr:ImmA/IrrE family metallo-endopeptidase [Lentzea jiangxiensis]